MMVIKRQKRMSFITEPIIYNVRRVAGFGLLPDFVFRCIHFLTNKPFICKKYESSQRERFLIYYVAD